MKVAWYERNGAAREVLTVGEMPMPEPGPGEVRVKLHVSGANPSDVKSRRGRPLAFPRIVPHSDGAGVVDAIHPAGLAIFIGICLMSLVVAKSFCSHICPVGLLSEQSIANHGKPVDMPDFRK